MGHGKDRAHNLKELATDLSGSWFQAERSLCRREVTQTWPRVSH